MNFGKTMVTCALALAAAWGGGCSKEGAHPAGSLDDWEGSAGQGVGGGLGGGGAAGLAGDQGSSGGPAGFGGEGGQGELGGGGEAGEGEEADGGDVTDAADDQATEEVPAIACDLVTGNHACDDCVHEFCAAPCHSCETNAECVAILDCIKERCVTGGVDFACALECENAHPEGTSDFDGLVTGQCTRGFCGGICVF